MIIRVDSKDINIDSIDHKALILLVDYGHVYCDFIVEDLYMKDERGELNDTVYLAYPDTASPMFEDLGILLDRHIPCAICLDDAGDEYLRSVRAEACFETYKSFLSEDGI